MNSFVKVILACTVVGFALYFLVEELLVTSKELPLHLDVRSLSHDRPGESQAMPIDDLPVARHIAAEREAELRELARRKASRPVADKPDASEQEDAAEESIAGESEEKDAQQQDAAVQEEEQIAVVALDVNDEPTTDRPIDEDDVADSDTGVVASSASRSKDNPDTTQDTARSAAGDGTQTSTRRNQRTPPSPEEKLKSLLGVTKEKPSVRAVDVAIVLPANCEANAVSSAPVTVEYRYDSPTIRGDSLLLLQTLMAEYRRCGGGQFRLSHNPLGKEDGTATLRQLRLDELKYFFLQHSVPKSALRFPEDS